MPLLFDLFLLFFVVLQLLLFSVAVRKIFISKLIKNSGFDDLPMVTSFGLLVLAFFCAMLGMLHLPSIWILATPVFLLQCYGIWLVWRDRRKALSYLKKYVSPFCFIGGLSLVSGVFWAYVFRELPSLVSYNDGVTHMAFFLRIMDSGNALTHMTPLSLGAYFGEDNFHFYPTGGHAIIAVFDGLFIKLGLLSAADVFRTWQLLVGAAVGPLCWWIARRLIPGCHEVCYFLVGSLGITNFYFPVWSLDSGGISRALAFVIVLPICAAILGADRYSHPDRVRYGALLPGLTAAFFIHASAFGMLAFTATSAFIVVLLCQTSNRHQAMKTLMRYGAALLVGGAFLGLLVWHSSSVQNIDAANSKMNFEGFKWSDLWARLDFFRYRFWKANHRSPHWFGIRHETRQIFLFAGILFFLLPKKFTSKLNVQVRLFPFVMALISIFMLAIYFAPYRFLYRMGLIYLNQSLRLIEINFLAKVVLWSGGAALFSVLFGYFFRRYQNRVSRGAIAVVLSFFTVFWFCDLQASFLKTEKHMAKWIAKYHTVTRAESAELVEFLSEHTESNALLFYKKHVGETLEAQTGRLGLFMYGECPNNKSANCRNKEKFSHKLFTQLRRVAKNKREQACLDILEPFDAPVYLVTKSGRYKPRGYDGAEDYQVCSNLMLKAEKGKFLVWKFSKQSSF